MGLMNWLGFGKKEDGSVPVGASLPPVPASATQKNESLEVVVYGTNEATRCVNVRELLKRNEFPFRDIRVDDALTTRAWLQRATGDDGLPKVFVAAKCYGGFEDIQAMIVDGTFQQAIDGELETDEDDGLAALKENVSVESISELLKRGEILTINEGGSETDVWAEPYAKPPVVYYEGAPEPIQNLRGVAERIVARVEEGEIEIAWKEED